MWDSPPRKVLIIKKRNEPKITQILMEMAKYGDWWLFKILSSRCRHHMKSLIINVLWKNLFQTYMLLKIFVSTSKSISIASFITMKVAEGRKEHRCYSGRKGVLSPVMPILPVQDKATLSTHLFLIVQICWLLYVPECDTTGGSRYWAGSFRWHWCWPVSPKHRLHSVPWGGRYIATRQRHLLWQVCWALLWNKIVQNQGIQQGKKGDYLHKQLFIGSILQRDYNNIAYLNPSTGIFLTDPPPSRKVPPVLSFGMGSLGFLTPFEVEDFRENIQDVIEGRSLA